MYAIRSYYGDGRGVDGVRQPDGMYFLRVQGPGVEKTVKAILQR